MTDDKDKDIVQPVDSAAPKTADDNSTDALLSALDQLKATAVEGDSKPSVGTTTLKKIIGGDALNSPFVRGQIWVMLLAVMFIIVYVAVRYQCQQDMIVISNLEVQLKDAKYRALSSSSNLTEKCRETHILKLIKHGPDSMLRVPELPPYIIQIPENE